MQPKGQMTGLTLSWLSTFGFERFWSRLIFIGITTYRNGPEGTETDFKYTETDFVNTETDFSSYNKRPQKDPNYNDLESNNNYQIDLRYVRDQNS